MPRRVTVHTVYANIKSITPERVELDCGHGQDLPADLPRWLRDGIALLKVGDRQVCADCVQAEIDREKGQSLASS